MIAVVLIILGLGAFALFLAFVGENGYPHDCQDANRCPASIRCSDEKNMKCYRDPEK